MVIRKMSEIMDTANKEEDTRDATVATDPVPDQEKTVEVKVWKYPRTVNYIIFNICNKNPQEIQLICKLNYFKVMCLTRLFTNRCLARLN